MKKLLPWLIVLFVVFWVVTSPETFASSVQAGVGAVLAFFGSLVDVINGFAR
ncbi:hypothetical protein [Nocardioides bruguierae]|uniref:Uncharacterized protein n=1 Tax=Nocardioides bruguierae TaxID=2945102 RepID=A0A9X2D9M4_9ACTN|nr:hypothetical protein [Nocardioides bruguierae]MCL8024732.1 hypothetical protein [Nocardioides bruguierae]MCM0621915.1 hypothetical protein [Nocardioides bruguierae]